MRRLVIILLAGAAAIPAFAQHDGHEAPPPSPQPSQSPAQVDPHAGHQMEKPAAPKKRKAPAKARKPAKQADPHAGHSMPEQSPAPAASDPHAVHGTGAQPSQPSDAHAGHGISTAASPPGPPDAPPPPEALTGPAHAADTVFDPEQMAAAREDLRVEHGDILTYWVMAERIEARFRDGENGYMWEAKGW